MFGTGLCGTTIWGGVAPGYAVAETPPTPPTPPTVQNIYIIMGVKGENWWDVSSLLLSSTLRIKDEINSRSSAEFSIKDPDGVFDYPCGTPVRILLNTALIFSGLVDEVEEEYIGGGLGDLLVHHFSCCDWNAAADWHYVTASFTTPGQKLWEVVHSILFTYSGEEGYTLGSEGIDIDTKIDPNTVLGNVTFDHVPCSEAFDQISEKTGFWWRIDPISYSNGEEVKLLRFFELSKNPAPYVLDPEVWGGYRNLSVRWSQEKYRNVQYLRGGKASTSSTVTDSFIGKASTGSDKSELTYTLRYPVSDKAKPVILVNDVAVPPGDIDIRRDEEDQDDYVDWFYAVGSNAISQANRDGFDALTSSDTLDVTYYGLMPMLIEGRNVQEIFSRQAITGGTGIVTDLDSDDSITDSDSALEKVYELLRRNARTPAKIKYTTFTNGFRAGQVLTVNLAGHGIAGQFLIESVTMRSVAEKFFEFQIQATEGESDGSWVTFWRRLAQRTRPPSIGDNESLYMVRQPIDGLVIGEAVSLTQSLMAWTADLYTRIALNGYCIGTIKEDGAVVGPMMGWPYGTS